MNAMIPGAAEAARRIREGSLTSEALVRQCLARIEEREAAVGAWTWLDAEGALAAARAADQRGPGGPLHGVPIGVKDIIDTADMPTGLGFAPYSGRQPAWDAACVAACRRAGAIVLGKTVTTEFAYFAAGKTCNPHDPQATPGGSSSGSAAAVADGMVPVAFGSQTAASLVRPAAFCGVLGYKASHGEFSLGGIRPFAESFDSLGVLARSVEDLRLMRDVLLLREPAIARDAGATNETGAPRIGVCRTGHWDRLHPAAQSALESTAAHLYSAGARVDMLALPESFDVLEEAHRTVMAHEACRAYVYECDRHRGELSAAFLALCEHGAGISRATYLSCLKDIGRARDDFARAFDGYSAWLAPSALGEAPPARDGTGDPLLSRAWTALQAPAVAMPAGTGPRGLPVGVQLLSPQGSDDALLVAAQWAQERMN
jgi:amidase